MKTGRVTRQTKYEARRSMCRHSIGLACRHISRATVEQDTIGGREVQARLLAVPKVRAALKVPELEVARGLQLAYDRLVLRVLIWRPVRHLVQQHPALPADLLVLPAPSVQICHGAQTHEQRLYKHCSATVGEVEPQIGKQNGMM